MVSNLDKKYLRVNPSVNKKSIFVSSVGYDFPNNFDNFIKSNEKDHFFDHF